VKVLIVDDEPPARERLRRQLAEFPDCGDVAEAASGEEAVACCEDATPDVVLMDIRMPGIGGLEAARRISRMPAAPAVIFTTAYDEYALDAYSAGPADYLMKPIRSTHLARALAKASRPTRAQLVTLGAEAPASPAAAAPGTAGTMGGDTSTRRSVTARHGDRLQVIAIDRILAFRADHKYTSVLFDEGSVLIDDSLKSLERTFAQDLVRIHRETLVNLRYVVALRRDDDGYHVAELADGKGSTRALRISRRHLAGVRQRLRQA
jgi:two-component system response regulator AlgR